jgi:hypothetical protein
MEKIIEEAEKEDNIEPRSARPQFLKRAKLLDSDILREIISDSEKLSSSLMSE